MQLSCPLPQTRREGLNPYPSCNALLGISQESNKELPWHREHRLLKGFVEYAPAAANVKQHARPHSLREPASLVASWWKELWTLEPETWGKLSTYSGKLGQGLKLQLGQNSSMNMTLNYNSLSTLCGHSGMGSSAGPGAHQAGLGDSLDRGKQGK